jgi:hypothetical protein
VAISYIISMGAAGATNQIVKESHSYIEWDFFCSMYFEWVVFWV